MALDFLMPKLGLTMEEGTILEWLLDDGAAVEPGTPVLRIETDKVESDVEAAGAGRLHRLAEVGSTHPCGAVIALLLGADERPPTTYSSSPASASSNTATPDVPTSVAPMATSASSSAPAATRRADGRIVASPNARRVAAELGIDLATVLGTGPDGRIVSEDVEEASRRPRPNPVTSAAPVSTGSHVLATAAARQLADLLGIDLGLVAPDSTDGRVSRDGVAAHVRQLLSAARPAAGSSGSTAAELAPASQTPTSTKRMSGMRGTIAKRMHASLQTMAQLTLTMDADMDAVVADRESRKDRAVVPGFTDYVIAACARALREHGIVNSQVTTDGIALLPDVHVGMAVALDEGLVVPVVRNADRLSLESLATETKRLATAARDGALALGDLEGGTFSVSALGMFGVDAFTPVINPPNTAIMGVGRLRDDVVLDGTKVATRTRLTLSFTWDHRVFDGAPAAEFTRTVCRLLSSPTQLDR